MTNITSTLTEIETLTSAVAGAMAEVSSILEKDEIESDDAGNLRHLVEFIIERKPTIHSLFYISLDSVFQYWNYIIQNDMLQGKVREYMKLGMEFLDKTDKFDISVADTRYDMAALVGESWFARELLQVMSDWEKNARPVLEFLQHNGGFEPRLADPFETAVRKLRPYFTGVGAEGLRALVMNGVSLANRQKWMQDRRQAVVMAETLGISCRTMNLSFIFTNRSGEERPLKFSSDRPDLDYRSYDIFPILKELQAGIEEENKSHKKALKAEAL